jgi:hypothetical protein
MVRRGVFLAGLLLVSIVPTAFAVITTELPLDRILKQAQFILTAKVESIDAEKLTAVLTADEDLKGKFPVRRLLVNLTGNSEAKKGDHTKMLLKRLAPKMTIVLFITEIPDNKEIKYYTFAFTNGTWFQMLATKVPEADKTVFAFTNGEPYLRRTFKGTTEEMKTVVSDVLGGKAKAPKTDPKEPPGFGPEATPEKKDSDNQAGMSMIDALLVIMPRPGPKFDKALDAESFARAARQ